MKKLSVRQGDRVIVIAGKYKGKKSKVLAAFPAEGLVQVEGVNIVKKHAKPAKNMQQGGIKEMEAPLDVSNVAVVCPACSKPTRVGSKLLPSGSRVRSCKKCGESLDK